MINDNDVNDDGGSFVPAPAASPASSSASPAMSAVSSPTSSLVTPDPWQALRAATPARIALGRVGASLPTAEVLRFSWAHGQAQDAVQRPLDVPALRADLTRLGLRSLVAGSQAADRETYLLRPDLGRRLALADAEVLRQDPAAGQGGCDLAVVVGDGLSSIAVQRYAPQVLQVLPGLLGLPGGGESPVRLAPIIIATQARVALADEIGALLGAKLAIILIGERPGLSSPDSMGAYITWNPQVGRHDAERNCISNIRAEGLRPEEAAHRLAWFVRAASRRRMTGVSLKDESGLRSPGAIGHEDRRNT